MIESATIEAPLTRATLEQPVATARAEALVVTIATTHRIEDVEAVWRRLEAQGIESPGQSYDVIRLWIEARRLPASDQLYLVASLDGRPVALLPLHRQRRAGLKFYTWFPGAHVGCGAPLLAAERFAALSLAERRQFWAAVAAELKGADFAHLAAVPERAYGIDGLFAELGHARPTETLYRAVFSSWDEANTTQRSKSRRKHDRQQGEKLEALGKVDFEIVAGGTPEAVPVLAEMFRQRARRFAVMGVADPFAAADISRFYESSVAAGSTANVRLHVLRLDGEIVAVRYNIVHGRRLFCLISSMSDDERIQVGSPGKQCLLRVMQTEFDAGATMFDMGAGFTDEKRHWCNVRIGLASHYLPLTLKGRAVVAAHGAWLSTRARIKANPVLLRLVKTLRSKLHRKDAAPAVPAPEAE